MIKMNFTSLIVAIVLALSTSITLAEDNSAVSTGQLKQNTPVRGSTMALVQKQLGQPVKKLTAIGEPPITRWVYNDFIVYFEHNLVLHSVFPQK